MEKLKTILWELIAWAVLALALWFAVCAFRPSSARAEDFEVLVLARDICKGPLCGKAGDIISYQRLPATWGRDQMDEGTWKRVRITGASQEQMEILTLPESDEAGKILRKRRFAVSLSDAKIANNVPFTAAEVFLGDKKRQDQVNAPEAARRIEEGK
ncbi:MAG: hypothetical protein AB1921_16055 [Thermodesulfobacteriota bacterium]